MPAPSKGFRLEKNAARLKRYRLSLRRKPGSQSERAAAGTTRRRKTYRAYTRARISAPPSSARDRAKSVPADQYETVYAQLRADMERQIADIAAKGGDEE